MNKLKILIVEDSEDRIKWFEQEFADCDLTICRTAEEGISKVTSIKMDAIMLDHDLGGQIFVDSSEPNTGYAVAKAIATSINKDTPVLIHSYNPIGANNIRAALPKSSTIMPFGTFKRDILKG